MAQHARIRAIREMEDQIDNEVWNGLIKDLPRPHRTAQHKRFIAWADRHMRDGRFANWAEKRTEWLNLRALPVRYTENSLVPNLNGTFPSRGGPPVREYSVAFTKKHFKEASRHLAEVDERIAETNADIANWKQIFADHAANLEAHLQRKKANADTMLASLASLDSFPSTTTAKVASVIRAEGSKKRSTKDALERPVIKSPRRDEPTKATTQDDYLPLGVPDEEPFAGPGGDPIQELQDSLMRESTPPTSFGGAAGSSFVATLAIREPQSSSSVLSANALGKQPQVEDISAADEELSGLSAKALGKRTRVENPSPVIEEQGLENIEAEQQRVDDVEAEQRVEYIEAAGYALFVLAENSLDEGTPDVWLSIALLSEAARNAIKTRLVEAVERKQAKDKWRVLTKRGDSEVTRGDQACIECDCTHRNRRLCTHSTGRAVPSTKQACNKCLDDKRPCGRLIFHPSGTGHAIGFSPVPLEYRPAATAWADLAYWVRHMEPWTKLQTTKAPVLVKSKPSGAGKDYQTRAKWS
jgi:hypothetical protein